MTEESDRWVDYAERGASSVSYCTECQRWTGHDRYGDCEVCS